MNRGLFLAAAGITTGAAVAALAMACLGPEAASNTWDPSTPLAEQCGDSPGHATRAVVQTRDGFELGAATLTSPETAPDAPVLIVRHGRSHTLCDWLPWAAQVNQSTGAVVLLMDRRGQGSSPGRADLSLDPSDVRALIESAGLVDAHGEFVLLGSSMGNASALSLPEQLPKAPCAVIGVSPVPAAGPLDGVAALRATDPERRPRSVHLTWSADDQNVPALATEVADAARFLDASVLELEVSGDAHARAVLDRHPRAQRFVEDAIAACR